MRDQLVENEKIEKKRLIPKQRMQKSRCYLVEKKRLKKFGFAKFFHVRARKSWMFGDAVLNENARSD